VTTELKADLVLSGGGVKGIGLSGAAVALLEAGYAIQRVSGTSAGSVVGAILAAGADELTPAQVEQLPDLAGYLKYASEPEWQRVRLDATRAWQQRRTGEPSAAKTRESRSNEYFTHE